MTTQTLYTPKSGNARKPNVLLRFLHAFRHWRKGRPFPAGLLIVLAGIELWLAPLSSIGTIIHEGIGGISAFFIGALMMMFGLTVWVAPAYRFFAGIASILLGLIALPATNLGGFFIGTLLALIGGALATSWVPRPGWEAPTWGERRRAKAARAREANRPSSGVDAAQVAVSEADPAEAGAAERTATMPTVAELELAQLEARVHEPVTPLPEQEPSYEQAPSEAPTADIAEVENTGGTERPEV
jgi:hypothetical protein